MSDSYLINEAARALRGALTEEEFESAVRDALEAVLEEGEGEDDGPDLVEVRTLEEGQFLTGNRGLTVRWPTSQQFTLEIGVYRRAVGWSESAR